MKAQALIIFIILSFGSVTSNPITDITDSYFEFPNVDKMLQALEKFRQGIINAGSIPSSGKFLQLGADANKIDPLTAALQHVRESVDLLNKEYDGFFDTKRLEDAQKFISQNKQTVYAVDNNQAVAMLNSLDIGLMKMNTVKNTIREMINKITGGVTNVKTVFEDTINAENSPSGLTDEQKKLAFTVNVRQLNKILEASLQDSYNSSND